MARTSSKRASACSVRVSVDGIGADEEPEATMLGHGYARSTRSALPPTLSLMLMLVLSLRTFFKLSDRRFRADWVPGSLFVRRKGAWHPLPSR